MAYPPDPGGVFASDAHRRVMANLPNPDDDPLGVPAFIAERIARDTQLGVGEDAEDAVAEILEDLEADGHAKRTKDGWRNTKDGFEALTGPAKERGAAGPVVLALDAADGRSGA